MAIPTKNKGTCGRKCCGQPICKRPFGGKLKQLPACLPKQIQNRLKLIYVVEWSSQSSDLNPTKNLLKVEI